MKQIIPSTISNVYALNSDRERDYETDRSVGHFMRKGLEQRFP